MSHGEDVVLLGAAESDLGETPDYSALELMAQAGLRALSDAGVDKAEVDALFTATAQAALPSLTLSEYLGITPRYLDSTVHGGASCVSHVHHAVGAIRAGLCEVALIAYGSTQRSELKRSGQRPAVAHPPALEAPYDPMYPVSSYALMAQRHMAEHGTTREQLAEVAVAASRWASLNPQAFRRKTLTVDDVITSPTVSSPLRAKDCCLITDGGGALVVTSAERARRLSGTPVAVLGSSEITQHDGVIAMPDLTTTAATETGQTALNQAGVAPEDIDVAELYDSFTINTIMLLEDLGFCKKGAGGEFVADGRISPDGALAVNTSGGGLSYCHPGMFGVFTVIEAVRQLRGYCGDRQVDNAQHALTHGVGGTMSSHATLVLARA